MTSKRVGLLIGSLVVLLLFKGTASSEERTWTDAGGKFSVTAELVTATDDYVVLRRADGQQTTVPRKKLSKGDLAFLEKLPTTTAPDPEVARKEIVDLAQGFYSDLRTEKREGARGNLTETAQKVMKGEKSPLAMLPKPDAGNQSIRPGRIRIDGNMAELVVRVRAGGTSHKTKIHLRYEQDEWRVFAMSATYPDGEQAINFEAAVSTGKKNSFDALVGKKLPLEGYSINGQKLNMSRYRGKVVLVDFWATWCGPCRAEIPNILANWKKHHDDGFEVIAISTDRDLPTLEKFVAEENPPWVVIADKSPKTRESMSYRYNVRSIPRFILLDRSGKVVSVNCRGKRLGEQLSQLMNDKS